MAKVIFETIQRGVRHYHKIESFPVSIGRALDNDIILQDVTISPHHLSITDENGGYQITNLMNENGTKINRKEVDNSPQEVTLPVNIQISNLKARLLATDMAVEDTRLPSCSGFFCIFSNPIWAMLLLVSTIGLFFLEYYFATPFTRDVIFYVSNVLPSILIMLGITVAIAGVSRLSTHRWEMIPAISIASLIFLVPQLFDYLGHSMSYFFASDSIGSWLKYSSLFLIIPVLLAAFIVKTVHSKGLPALGIAMLVYSPFLAYQVVALTDKMSLTSGFSKVPSYSQILMPGNIRLNNSISLEQFMHDAEKATTEHVEKMLQEAKDKNEEES